MRRQTQWALGGVLAGTMLLGAGTTLATFTDQAQSTATAGAASLALQVTPARGNDLQVHSQQGATELLVTSTGGLPGRLWLSLPDEACGDLPDVVLTVTGLDGATSSRTLCGLTTDSVDLGTLAAATAGTPITLQVQRDSASTDPSPAAVDQWVGLRFDLVQDVSGTGLSDAQTLQAHVVVRGGQTDTTTPAGQVGGQPGSGGQSPGNSGTNGQQPGNGGNGGQSPGNSGNNGQGGGRIR